MNELIALIEEYIHTIFNFNVFVGIIAGVAVFVLEIIYTNKHPKRNKKLEKAKQLGNVVTAKRVSTWTHNKYGTSMDSWVYAKYVYEVNGKQYQYKYMERQFAPIALPLYYIHSPRKVFTGNERKGTLRALLFYLVPMAVTVTVIILLGGV